MGQVGERIKQFRIEKNIKITDILEKTGWDRTTYWRYENGESEVDINFVSILIRQFPIRAYWLLTGEGEMEWGTANEEVKFLTEHILKDEDIKKTLFHFLQWQLRNGKGNMP
jgi:transcriptional regulator with XRE-family HTH domain